jgi:predicted transcriptional regulator
MLLKDPVMTYDTIAGMLGISRSTVQREIKALRDSGRLSRKGATRGEWVVIGTD